MLSPTSLPLPSSQEKAAAAAAAAQAKASGQTVGGTAKATAASQLQFQAIAQPAQMQIPAAQAGQYFQVSACSLAWLCLVCSEDCPEIQLTLLTSSS